MCCLAVVTDISEECVISVLTSTKTAVIQFFLTNSKYKLTLGMYLSINIGNAVFTSTGKA